MRQLTSYALPGGEALVASSVERFEIAKARAALKGLCENVKRALKTEIKAGKLRGAFTVTNR